MLDYIIIAHIKICIQLAMLSSQGSSTLPIGTILPYVGALADIPHGWALCDGSNGTPNLTGRFLQGWGWDNFNLHSVGDYIQAGLPNITGHIGTEGIGASGAFYKSKNQTSGDTSVGGDTDDIYYFNASLCSPIYGRSNTVQPASYTVYYIMRIS